MPEYTGFERDLYSLTVAVVAGMDKHAVEEKILRHVDSAAARVRGKLEFEGFSALGTQDRVDWVRFLMSLRIRQPGIVRKLVTDSADHLRNTLSAQIEEDAAQTENLSLTQWTEKTFPGLIDNFGLTFFNELLDSPDVGDKILKLKWWLWTFTDGHPLLLSDRPCIFTGGIDDEHLVIALPISPRKAFLASRSERVASVLRRQSQKDLSRMLNETSLGQATRRIYCPDRTCERFIENRLYL